jgi:hypothetical protein
LQAGPRDKEAWIQRLKEEYQSLIKYVSNNKEKLSSGPEIITNAVPILLSIIANPMMVLEHAF